MTALLAADLGGTRARFLARLPDGAVAHVELPAASFPTAADAIRAALVEIAVDAPGARVALAVAGPVRDGAAEFTNIAWRVDAAALRDEFGFSSVALLNDVEAAALAAAGGLPGDAVALNDAPHDVSARHVLVSVGTGLGVAYWRGNTVDATEAGHARFAPADAWQRRLRDRLAADGPEVEWEHVVSGPGLAAADALERGSALAPAEVTRRATDGDPCARQAVARFSELVGAFAATAVLMGPAPGGVLIGGGVIAALGALFDADAFRKGFVHGRMGPLLAAVPAWRTSDTRLALRGALDRAAH